MEIMTRDFGKVEIKEEDIIKFPDGLPGFIDEKEFILLPLAENSPFIVMQSVKEEALAFITLEPWMIIKDYQFDIDNKVEKFLKVESEKDLLIVVIGTIKDDIKKMTVNLAAPVVINFNKKIGKQVILDEDYPIKQPVFNQENEVQEAVTC